MSLRSNMKGRASAVVALSALGVAAVAVALVGLVPAGAESPGCQGLTTAFNQVTNPQARQVLLNQLTANGCTVPGSSSSSSSSTSSSTTSSSTTSSSSTTPSSSSTSMPGGNGPCAGLTQALSNVTNPTAHAAVAAALARAGCPVTGSA
jgi:hypothetical protein